MGHAVYDADGCDQRAVGTCPFTKIEEVWNFDAVGEYGLPDHSQQVAEYQRCTDNAGGPSLPPETTCLPISRPT